MPHDREVDEAERAAFRAAFEVAMQERNVLAVLRPHMLKALDEVLAGEVDDLGTRIDRFGMDAVAMASVVTLLEMIT